MHKKIKELQKRAQPINYNVYVNKEGVLVDDRTIGGYLTVWGKVEYDEKTDSLLLKEISLMEGSVVTIGAVEGTYAFRSMEEYDERLLSNKIEIEHFIKSLPVGKRIEARHLFAEASSLSRHEPNLNSLRDRKPNDEGIDYKYLIENFKLS